jgi:hypothetical protein
LIGSIGFIRWEKYLSQSRRERRERPRSSDLHLISLSEIKSLCVSVISSAAGEIKKCFSQSRRERRERPMFDGLRPVKLVSLGPSNPRPLESFFKKMNIERPTSNGEWERLKIGRAEERKLGKTPVKDEPHPWPMAYRP